MAKTRPNTVTEWANRPRSKTIEPRVVAAIARRRRQMLLHSFLYYHMDSPIIDDATWTKWAQQLFQLHRKYGKRIGFYDAAFADWNGSSGYHLPADADVVRVARRVHDEFRECQDIIG